VVGEQLASAIKDARQAAAQKGATALVVLRDTEFVQKVGRRKLKVRRIHLPGNSPPMTRSANLAQSR
jgi:hypothetical protein